MKLENITDKNYPSSQEPLTDVTEEDDFMKLLDQFSSLMLPT